MTRLSRRDDMTWLSLEAPNRLSETARGPLETGKHGSALTKAAVAELEP